MWQIKYDYLILEATTKNNLDLPGLYKKLPIRTLENSEQGDDFWLMQSMASSVMKGETSETIKNFY